VLDPCFLGSGDPNNVDLIWLPEPSRLGLRLDLAWLSDPRYLSLTWLSDPRYLSLAKS